MIEIYDPFAPSEMNCEGSLFDTEEMERVKRKYEQGCWFWHDDYLALLYRDPQMRKAAPLLRAAG
jgi:hypothetical protein